MIKHKVYKTNQQMTRYLALIFLFSLSSCASSYINVTKAPKDLNLSGIWKLVSEDQESYKHFRQRAGHTANRLVLPPENNRRNPQAHASSRSMMRSQSVMLEMMINLLSLPTEELYIKQEATEVAIDYGVAGYHNFQVAEPSKLVFEGTELMAMAGWQEDVLVVQMVLENGAEVVQRFEPMDNNNLLQKIAIVTSRKTVLKHQRWYQRKRTEN